MQSRHYRLGEESDTQVGSDRAQIQTRSAQIYNATLFSPKCFHLPHSNTLVQKDVKLPAELKQKNFRIKKRTVPYKSSKSVVLGIHSIMKYVLNAYWILGARDIWIDR